MNKVMALQKQILDDNSEDSTDATINREYDIVD